MQSGRHFVEWQGERYAAEPLRSMYRVTSLPPVWAVSRGGEFIGTLPCRPEDATSTNRGERSGVGFDRLSTNHGRHCSPDWTDGKL
jgi:hypothetical protein